MRILARFSGYFLALALPFAFLSCLDSGDPEDVINVEGDSAWISYSSVHIYLTDTSGNILDTLYLDSLPDLGKLRNLPVDNWPSGPFRVRIEGYRGSEMHFLESWTVPAKGKPIPADSGFNRALPPRILLLSEDSVDLRIGGEGAVVHAATSPAGNDAGTLWVIRDSSVVALAAGSAGAKFILPKSRGTTRIVAFARLDSTIRDSLFVAVGYGPTGGVDAAPISVRLFWKGNAALLTAAVSPATSDQRVDWVSSDPEVFSIDGKGSAVPVNPGAALAIARSLADPSLADTVRVTVVKDPPRLSVRAPGRRVNILDTVTFEVEAVQEFGVFRLFRWDLDGDGSWEASEIGPWPDTLAGLGPRTTVYRDPGKHIAAFSMEDGEGNVTMLYDTLIAGNRRPTVALSVRDTTVSIGDAVPMRGSARDADGSLTAILFDFDGNGAYDDSLPAKENPKEFSVTRSYPVPGAYAAVIAARDGFGDTGSAVLRINVLLDPPVANAGRDTVVPVGAPFHLHALGTDALGSIAKREWKIGSDAFFPLAQQETTLVAPATPAELACILRITDDDGNAAYDTMIVRAEYGANASLSGLIATPGSLAPAFAPGTLNYSVTTVFADSLLRIAVRAADAKSTVHVNGTALGADAPSDPVKLAVGGNPNVFNIVVTAQNGAQKVYQVSARRSPNTIAALKSLAASEGTVLASGETEYVDTVAHGIVALFLTPEPLDANATILVASDTVPRGGRSGNLALRVGDNAVPIVVIAQDGTTRKEYSLKVVRKALLTLQRKLGSAISGTGSAETAVGAPIGITGAPVTGYDFRKWSAVGAVTIADPAARATTATLPEGDATAVAEYDTSVYALSVTNNGHGKTSPNGLTSIRHFTLLPIAAIEPETGYHFAKWVFVSGGGALADAAKAATHVSATGPSTIRADFEINTYTLAIQGANGSVTVSPVLAAYPHGTRVKLTAASSPGYHFTGWSGDASGTVDTVSFVMDGNKSVTADFPINTYALTVAGANGAVKRAPDLALYPHGTSVELTAEPAAGYQFTGWAGGLGTEAKISVTMDGPKTVTANFALKTYTLTVVIACNPGSSTNQTALHGVASTITAPPVCVISSGGGPPTVLTFKSWSIVTGTVTLGAIAATSTATLTNGTAVVRANY